MLFAFRLGLLCLFLSQLGKAPLRAQQVTPGFIEQFTPPPTLNFNTSEATQDRQGNLWFATNEGIVRFDGRQFRVYHDPVLREGDDYSNLALSPDGRIWSRIGRSVALSYIDPRLDRIVRVPDSTQVVRDYLAKGGYSFLFVDAEAYLWMGLPNHSLIRVNPRTYTVDVAIPTLSQPDEWFRWITQDRRGTIWFTTNYAVYAYSPVSHRLKRYRQGLGPTDFTPQGQSKHFALGIHARADGKILVGFSNEVDLIDPVTDQITRMELLLTKSYPGQGVFHFYDDQQGNTYFKTISARYRYTREGELQQLEFGGITQLVKCLYPGRDNRLWVSTGSALLAYDLTRIRPVPPLNLVDVVINGSPYQQATSHHQLVRDSLGHATLRVKEDDFINLRISPFASYHVQAFRLRLEGHDRQWSVMEDAVNPVAYQLSGGTYTLALSLFTSQTGWGRNVSTMTIIVVPPYWKTGWFIALVGLSLAGLSYWLIRSQTRRRRLRRELARREFEAATLRELDGLKSQFFTNITHELRTPLTIIFNATEQMDQASWAEPDRQRLKSVQRNTEQLMRLINETLDMAKLDAGKLDRREQIGDPLAFVEQVLGQFAALAQQRQITLSWTGRASEAWSTPRVASTGLYRFDGDKLEKIAYNLLANALKFTPAGGQVQVEGQLTTGHRFVLQVADTGIGIPADQLSRIFERFHQVDSSSTRVYSGTGIGLAWVKELTEWLGGSVDVTSTVGQGSVFTVSLPLTLTAPAEQVTLASAVETISQQPVVQAVSGPAPHATGHPHPAPARATNRPVVLVVEDNEELRTYISAHLQNEYRVLTAENGWKGLEQALAEIPDLIVSDVMMPEMDGYELVERLKADERTSHIPIILLTAKASYDSRMKGLGAGADDYMGKPFSLEELSLRIGNCLRTRQNWQQRLTMGVKTNEAVLSANPRLDKEERFLARLRGLILNHLTNEKIDVDWLSEQAGMSRAQLHRKLTALTNQSATRFIHSVRIGQAVALLQTGELNIAQVAQAVGYSSQSYFTKMFVEQQGYPPTGLKV